MTESKPPAPRPVPAVRPPLRGKDRRGRKALKVLGGIGLMAAFVGVALLIVVQFAGAWGVPYFTFTTDRGSPCRNTFTGYRCTPLTLADVEYYGDLDLPDDTTVTSGSYHSTHDYQLEALLEVPAASAGPAWQTLSENFGKCLPGHPSPISTRGLSKVCVQANDDSVIESGEPASRLYTVTTGLRADGSRVIAVFIKSR